MIRTISNILAIPELKKRLLVTLFIFAIFRFVASIPVPGADPAAIRQLFQSSQLLGILNVVSGGVMENFSLVTLGLGPYITASIIIQMLTTFIPALERLYKEEGEYGREKINQYTRLLTIPLATFQALAMYFLFSSQGLVSNLSTLDLLVLIVTLVAGASFLLWLGDQLTQYGIGNGVSLLIFAGIVSSLPRTFSQTAFTISAENLFPLISIAVVAVLVVYLIVRINEGARRIPISYARKVRGNRLYGGQETHLPLKVNQAGVIPIIYAISLILMPSFLGQFLARASNPALVKVANFIMQHFQPNAITYNVLYFLLVLGFTYFSTAIYSNPDKMAEDIKKRGGFVPGMRPGKATADYLNFIITRITLVGGLFLGLVAVLPSLTQQMTGIASLSIGGTGLLIVVSVILDTLRQIEALMVTREYEGFL